MSPTIFTARGGVGAKLGSRDSAPILRHDNQLIDSEILTPGAREKRLSGGYSSLEENCGHTKESNKSQQNKIAVGITIGSFISRVKPY